MRLLASSVCGLFKWRPFEPEVILLAVGWYLRFSVREPGGMERGRCPTVMWRSYSPSGACPPITSRCGAGCPALRPGIGAAFTPAPQAANDSWRVDETHIRVKG